jgi:Creatinase/Prolidase N-terminal domain
MRRGLISRSLTELPDAVLDARLARLRAAMTAAKLDAVLVYTNNTRPAAVSWLTGFVPYWSEAMLVVPKTGATSFVVALTFRVKPWIERTSRVGQVIHTPRIGVEAARVVAGAKDDAVMGVVDLDQLPVGIADDLAEDGPHLTVLDASDLFAALRQAADPTEIMLANRATAIADAALAHLPGPPGGIRAIVGAIEGEARRRGAEEVYVAAAPDLSRDIRFVRIEEDVAIGPRFALRASVAYKGVWVRRVVTFDHDGPLDINAIEPAFAAAVADLPSGRGFAPFASYLVEGCRTGQPLEPLMGSRIKDGRAPRGIVSVQAATPMDGLPMLLGAPALVGAAGEAASLLNGV